MKLTRPLASLGLLAVAATSLLGGPVAAHAAADAPPPPATTALSPDSADRLTGPLVMQVGEGPLFYGFKWGSGTSGRLETTSGRDGVSREEAIKGAIVVNYPAPGTTGPIVYLGGNCLGSALDDPGAATWDNDFYFFECWRPQVRQFTMDSLGRLHTPNGGVGREWDPKLRASWLTITGPTESDDRLDLFSQVPDVTPTVSVGTPTLAPGQSVEVEATFNADAAGQRIDIDHPAGTKVTAVANSAFSLVGAGATGVLSAGTRSLRFTLTADADAPVGSAAGGQISWYLSRIKLADFSATIVEPAATIPPVSVQQGASVDVPVSFNETALGATEVVVPAGFASGSATGGFTWDAALPGFRGTVTGSNREVVLSLTAKADAPVGAFEGRVTQAGTGLNQAWSATFEQGAPAPVAPLVVESPKVGDTIREAVPVFTGTAQPGSRVEVRGAWGDLLGSVDVVDSSGAWSIRWNKSVLPGRYIGGTVKQFVAGAATQTFTYDFTVEQSDIAPLVLTSPKAGETITDATPVFTGTAQPGARVEIRGAWGDVLGSVDSVGASGTWTVTWNKSLLPNRYAGGKVQQYVGGVLQQSVVYDFTLVQSRLVVTSPKVGDTIAGTRPVFTGRANPGARVQITGAWGTDLGSVDADARTGVWAITWPSDYLPARYSGGVVTERVGGKVIGTSGYDFTLIP